MKAELLKRLYKNRWASRLPGFEVRGHVLCAAPCGPVLRGFCFESSGWSKTRVYVTAFVQPLYIPSDHIVLSYGQRLGSGSHFWELDEKTPTTVLDELATLMGTDGLDFLRRRATPALLVDAYRREAMMRGDPHVRRLVAFSHAKGGKAGPAVRLLKKLLQPQPDAPEWERIIASESEMLLTALERGLDEADLLLNRWETETRQALKVPQ